MYFFSSIKGKFLNFGLHSTMKVLGGFIACMVIIALNISNAESGIMLRVGPGYKVPMWPDFSEWKSSPFKGKIKSHLFSELILLINYKIFFQMRLNHLNPNKRLKWNHNNFWEIGCTLLRTSDKNENIRLIGFKYSQLLLNDFDILLNKTEEEIRTLKLCLYLVYSSALGNFNSIQKLCMRNKSLKKKSVLK